MDEERVVADFHRLYYAASERTWRGGTHWLGVETEKCPLDLWRYQQLLVFTRPDVVLETGTFHGGSALFLASVFDALGGAGRVVTIDVEPQAARPAHPRIEYVQGSSSDGELAVQVLGRIPASARVMVVLDSDHRREHVLAELELYGSRVSVGCYLVVEDTNVNGNPVYPEFGPGPREAVVEFLERDRRFAVDRDCERFLLTFNPGGYLRRVS